ncbi:MAG TPA: hypothetical protein VF746_15355 [Longimicrobium sp.]|jgi:hypothetical protein
MGGNKLVYKEAFERARDGKSRSLWERLLFPFQDEYTRQSREQGERDGAAARAEAARGGQDAPGPSTAN